MKSIASGADIVPEISTMEHREKVSRISEMSKKLFKEYGKLKVKIKDQSLKRAKS